MFWYECFIYILDANVLIPVLEMKSVNHMLCDTVVSALEQVNLAYIYHSTKCPINIAPPSTDQTVIVPDNLCILP